MTPGHEHQWSNNPKSFINDDLEALAKYIFVNDTGISTILSKIEKHDSCPLGNII